MQVIKMLVSILVIFVICWTPRVLQSFSLGLMWWSGTNPADFALDLNGMTQLRAFLRICSYFNSIVNVIIYYLTSK